MLYTALSRTGRGEGGPRDIATYSDDVENYGDEDDEDVMRKNPDQSNGTSHQRSLFLTAHPPCV
jgi:hypothetical protein